MAAQPAKRGTIAVAAASRAKVATDRVSPRTPSKSEASAGSSSSSGGVTISITSSPGDSKRSPSSGSTRKHNFPATIEEKKRAKLESSSRPAKKGSRGLAPVEDDEGDGPAAQPPQPVLTKAQQAAANAAAAEAAAKAAAEAQILAEQQARDAEAKRIHDAKMAAAAAAADDIKIDFKDEGDAKNESREREIESKIVELRSQGVDAITLDKWAKALQTLKKKNLMARKKRSDQAEKTQALEIFEQKQRLCERKRTLETRIATLGKMGMTLQVETLQSQLNEVSAKLRGDK